MTAPRDPLTHLAARALVAAAEGAEGAVSPAAIAALEHALDRWTAECGAGLALRAAAIFFIEQHRAEARERERAAHILIHQVRQHLAGEVAAPDAALIDRWQDRADING